MSLAGIPLPDGRTRNRRVLLRLTIGIASIILSLVLCPAFAERPELVAQTGHTNAINCLAFSPDGKLLATGSHDQTIILWDIRTGIEIRSLFGHTGVVTTLAFLPSGNTLVSGSLDGTIRFWDIRTGTATRVLPQGGSVNTLAVSPDGNAIAVGSWDHLIVTWDTRTGDHIRTFRGHSLAVNTVSFSSTGRFLASGGDDNTIRVWSVQTASEVRKIALPMSGGSNNVVILNTGKPVPPGNPEGVGRIVTDAVNWVAFSPDDKMLASVSMSVRNLDVNGIDFSVKLWDVQSGNEVRTLEAFSGGGPASKFNVENYDRNALTGSVAFSPDGKTIMARGVDYSVKLWDAASGRVLQSFTTVTFANDSAENQRIRHMMEQITWHFNPHLPTYSPNGQTFAIIIENSVYLRDAASGTILQYLGAHANSVNAVSFEPLGGTKLATASPALPSRLWSLESGSSIFTLDRGKFPFGASSIAYRLDGAELVTASLDMSGTVGEIDLWNSMSGKKISAITAPVPGNFNVAFAGNATGVFASRWNESTVMLDVSNGRVLRDFGKTYATSSSVAISRDGRILAHVMSNYSQARSIPTSEVQSIQSNSKIREAFNSKSASLARIWRADSGTELLRIEEPAKQMFAIALNLDGSIAAVGGGDNRVSVWNVARRVKLAEFDGDADVFYTLSFSPDHRMLAGAGLKGIIYLWDLATDREIARLKGHLGQILSITFSPDGKEIASGGADGTARLWDARSLRSICSFIATDQAGFLTATPDNYYLASRAVIVGIGFRVGLRGYPFDQFDLRLNRPDIVLERIGKASPIVERAYRRAHQRRLLAMGFEESMLGDDFHVPEVSWIGATPSVSATRQLKLKVRATDSKELLDRIQVYVNNVPVSEIPGLFLRPLKVASIERDVQLELSDGNNKVEVSALNVKGAESLRDSFHVTYTGPASTPKLYIAAIGVSKYKRSAFNLDYADQDAKALVQFYQQSPKPFAKVNEKLILNEEATKSSIDEVRGFLAQAGVDDVAIVFLAGHGMLDEKLDYYFGTTDIDFAHPAQRGISYDGIGQLLDGIAVRKKLLMIDTCHAGETDKSPFDSALPETQDSTPRALPATQDSQLPKVAVRGFSREAIVTPLPTVSESFELLHSLFVNFRRGSGAEVIGAVSGAGYAIETRETGHGVFTYALLEALRGAADRNNDGYVSVSELRDYVADRVYALTTGRQKPVVRQENLDLDFTVAQIH
jgi:WD40 repeat protein